MSKAKFERDKRMCVDACEAARKDEREKMKAEAYESWLREGPESGVIGRLMSQKGEMMWDAGVAKGRRDERDRVCEWELEDALGIGAHYHTGCTADVIRVREKQGQFCPKCGGRVTIKEAQDAD